MFSAQSVHAQWSWEQQFSRSGLPLAHSIQMCKTRFAKTIGIDSVNIRDDHLCIRLHNSRRSFFDRRGNNKGFFITGLIDFNDINDPIMKVKKFECLVQLRRDRTVGGWVPQITHFKSRVTP